MSVDLFEKLYWDAVKTKKDQCEDTSYLDLGGNSLGIFLFTESVKKELGIEIPPEELLQKNASLKKMKLKYLGV